MILNALQATDAFINGTGDNLPATSSQAYMSVSAGQYATADRFAFTQKLFGTDARFGTSEFNGKTHDDFLAAMRSLVADNSGQLSIADLKVGLANPATPEFISLAEDFKMDAADFVIGLTQPFELLENVVNGSLSISDSTDLTYVYGTSDFGISNDTIIDLGDDLLTLSLENLLIDPDPNADEDFNFDSSGSAAGVFNSAWAATIAPSSGTTFSIEYDGSRANGSVIPSFGQAEHLAAGTATAIQQAQNEASVRQWWATNKDDLFAHFASEAPDNFVDHPSLGPSVKVSIFGGGVTVTTSLQNVETLRSADGTLAIAQLMTAYLVEAELETDLGVELDIEDLVDAQLNAVSGRLFFGLDILECFPADTPITLANGTTKPIADIHIGDEVLSFKPDGSMVSGTVDKLFRNTTSKFVRLSFVDGRDDLVATPGHRFLTETGDFMEIGHMVRLGGGSVRLVEKDGSIVTARGEVLAYSAETAHLFEQAQAKATIYDGNLAVKHEAESGWATYNFEVREHHTYIANDIRVHNDSILSFLQEGDTVYALTDDLKDMAVARDTNGDGSKEIVLLDGERFTDVNGGDTFLEVQQTFIPNDPNADVEALLAQFIENNTDAAGNVYRLAA